MATDQEVKSVSPLVSPYEFTIEAEPKIIDLKDINILSFPRIRWETSIFNFWSYAVFILNDPIGLVIQGLLFIEGMNFKIKFGNKDLGYFENKWVWSENQILDARVGKHISGMNQFIFLSSEYFKDLPVSKGWKGMKISDIVTDIATNIFKVPVNKQHITPTIGMPDVPQMNEKNSAYIKRLANLACSSSNEKSPFYTFFNSQGEFYFMSLEELFKQKSEYDFEFIMDEKMALNRKSVKGYTSLMGGLPVSFENYKTKVYIVKDDGTYESQEPTMSDFHFKTSGEKILIRRSEQKGTSEVLDYGIQETSDDKYITKGKVASNFKNSAIPYRMQLNIQCNPKTVVGKVVSVNVDSTLEQRRVATEFSGKWLVIEEKLVGVNTDTPYQLLTLAKSTMKINQQHKITDFLS